jgi:hypothetical protein
MTTAGFNAYQGLLKDQNGADILDKELFRTNLNVPPLDNPVFPTIVRAAAPTPTTVPSTVTDDTLVAFGFIKDYIADQIALITSVSTGVVPIGAGIAYPIAISVGSEPTGFLIPNGRALLQSAYPALFALYNGQPWCIVAGSGGGATFTIPNWQDKFLYGAGAVTAGNTGGSSNSTISGGITNSTVVGAGTLTATGTALTPANLPAHAHSLLAGTATNEGNGGYGAGSGSGGLGPITNPNTGSVGSGTAHTHNLTGSTDTHSHSITGGTVSTLPPYFAVTWLIRAL